jgi:hypothetical protein
MGAKIKELLSKLTKCPRRTTTQVITRPLAVGHRKN